MSTTGPTVRAWVPEPRYPTGGGWWTRGRRRLVIVLGIVVGVLGAALLALWLALPWFVRSYVLERLEERLGIDLEAAEVDAGLGSVRLVDVQVRSKDTGLPLGRLGVLEAEVDVWALFRGRLAIVRLVLERPVVEVQVRGDDDWAEIVRLAHRALRSGKRLAGASGGGGLEVLVRDLRVLVAYGGDLRFEMAVPRLALSGRRNVRFDARDLVVRSGAFELARVASCAGALTLESGRAVLSGAVVRGASLQWTRERGQPMSEAPAMRGAAALRRMARVARKALADDAPTAAGGAPGPGGTGAAPAEACELPIEGTVRIEASTLRAVEPRLGPAPLQAASLSGRAVFERCGNRVRLEAAADGGPDAGGWSGWAERTPTGVSGALEVASSAFDDLMRRVWPGRALPPSPPEPVLFEIAHAPGEDSLRLSGRLPVPALEASAAGHRVQVGPERAAFELRVGPMEEGRLGLSGRADLTTAAYTGPHGSRSLRSLAVRLDPATRVASGLQGTRVVLALEGEPDRPVRVLDEPPLELVRPEVRADVTLSRLGGKRIGIEGSFQAAGLVSPGGPSEPAAPVLLAGAFDAGTWFDRPARSASFRGRLLADGLRIDRPSLPLVAFGPPGIEVAVDLQPGAAEGQWVAQGELGVRGVTVDSPKIARAPVQDVSFDISGVLTVDVPGRAATLDQGRAKVGAVEMAVNAAFALHGGTPAFRVAFAGSRTRCQDLLEALPSPLRSDLPGLEFGGSVDFSVAFDIDFADLRSTIFELDATSRCRVLAADGAIQMDRLGGTFRHEIMLPNGQTETVVTGPGSPDWVPLSQISRYMVSAVITTEDARFFRHSGVSIADLRQAIVRDLREGRFAYGGSTIDMQVVKNVFLDREKTVARKLQELILTWWMDQALDKTQILELYLNVIEYGPGIYGIGPAVRTFFGRTPADLSPLEAIYLAKLLPDPIARYRMYENGAVSPGWRARLDRLLGVMFQRGELTEAEYQAAVHDQIDFWLPGEPAPAPRYTADGAAAILETPEIPDPEPLSPAEEVFGDDAADQGGYSPDPDL